MANKKKGKRLAHKLFVSGQKRYRDTYKIIDEYYKDQGQKKTRSEILSDYHRIKHTCKNIPLKRLEQCIDKFFINREKHEFPEDLIIFNWYFFKDILQDTGWYFKDTDMIIIDASIINASAEFPYSDLNSAWAEFYRDNSTEIRKNLKYPKFVFSGQSENSFTWILEAEGAPQTQGAEPSMPDEPVEQPPIPPASIEKNIEIQKSEERIIEKKIQLVEKKIKSKETSIKLSEQKTKESKQRQKEIKQLENLLARKIITIAQFRKRFNKLSV